jgi:hypothetical protein
VQEDQRPGLPDVKVVLNDLSQRERGGLEDQSCLYQRRQLAFPGNKTIIVTN